MREDPVLCVCIQHAIHKAYRHTAGAEAGAAWNVAGRQQLIHAARARATLSVSAWGQAKCPSRGHRACAMKETGIKQKAQRPPE